MKAIIAFFKSFAGTKRDISKIDSQLRALKTEMEQLQNMPNKVNAIVKLFQVISPLQDVGGFSNAIEDLEKKDFNQKSKKVVALKILQKHFANAGRSPYGMNRTEKGEEVTAKKVYLGNVFGLFTKTAAYWLENQKKFEADLRPDISKDSKNPATTWYCINDHQAGKFVQSHTEGILEQITVLLAA